MAKKPDIKLSYNQLKEVLEYNFDFINERSSSDELVIICPESGCGDRTGNRSFNVKSGLTNCWRCKTAGATTWFLRKHGVLLDSSSLEDIHLDESPLEKLSDSLQDKLETPTVVAELPAGFTFLADDPTGVYAKYIGHMAKRKNLDLIDFIEANVGFTKIGPWEPYAIFPVYENNKLVTYQGRTYSESAEGAVTKKFPRKSEAPGSRNWVYGLDEARQPGLSCVIVVESILNVLSLKKILKELGIYEKIKPVAVFKHAISPLQFNKIFNLDTEEFCIMFDGEDFSIQSAITECSRFTGKLATIATMPLGIDANDNSKLAIERFIDRKVPSPLDLLKLSL